MKIATLCFALLWGMNAICLPQGQQTSAPEERQASSQQQKRPTLGPAPAPSLYGPRTSNTFDPHRLVRVRKIYIERMDNSLDQKLVDLLGKTRRFQIVEARSGADAVLRGTCFDSRRLKQLRSEVYLNDPNGPAIWQDIIHRPLNPPTIEAAVNETANLIVSHLGESVAEAERR